MASMDFTVVVTTRTQVEKAFDAWNKDFQANPDDYVSMENFDPAKAAEHFIKLLHQV